MIPLGASGRPSALLRHRILGRVTRSHLPSEVRTDHIWIGGQASEDLGGYSAALLTTSLGDEAAKAAAVPVMHSMSSLGHLEDGDVVALDPSGYVRTLYRINSQHNAILATDRCNSYCLMCSQPPKPVDDSELIREHLQLVELMDPSTKELGITGGEPTLLKDDLMRLIHRCKERLPTTSLHILSNGRLFYYGSFARAVAEIGHPQLVFGIPLYSDLDYVHDYVVQCRGAFDDTVVGLQNLARYGVGVEIRVVIHRMTYERLLELSQFIYQNFPFALHVALMGLEPIGLAIPNLEKLWIDPWDYRQQLAASVLFLRDRGMEVSVYNHQLCVVPDSVWPACRQSISDWKREYLPRCDSCGRRAECGGFFTSSVQRRVSAHITPFSQMGSSSPTS